MVLSQIKDKLSSDKGVISAFSLMIIGSFFFMFLAIYNWTIYSLGVQRLEDSLEFSLNSVLSSYDGDVMRELGLFVFPKQEELTELGRSYFWRNMAVEDGMLDLSLLEYKLIYPTTERFSILNNLEEQILKQEAYDGWLSLGSAFYEFLNIHSLPSDFSFVDAAATENDLVGQGFSSDWLSLIKEILGLLTENEFRDKQIEEEVVAFWQLLSPFPQFNYENKRLPDLGMSQSFQTEYLDEELIEENLEKVLGQAKGIIEYTQQLKDKLKESLTREKNQILRSEYILQQWDYATAKPLRSRYFNKAEVEYILCGKKAAWNNIRYTAFSIFLFRTILHSGYQFINSPINSLYVRLGEAVLQGIIQSKQEVEQLFAGKKVAAFPGQKQLQMSYKDHLRLFLMLQPPDEQLKRLQDLLQINIGYWQNQSKPADLNQYYQGLQAKVVIKLKLWPIGHIQLVRQGALGYDAPFELVELH